MTFFGAHSFVAGGGGVQPGIIKTARTAPLGVLGYANAASYTGSSDANHIDGYVAKSGTSAFVFPVGNGSKIRTVGISAPSATATFKAAYWFSNPNTAALPAGGPFFVTNLGTGVTAVSTKEYWDLDGPSAVNVTLTWDAASDLSTLTAATIANLAIVGYNTAKSKWEKLGTATTTTGTLAATGTITANGVIPDNYSAFTFGSAVVAAVPDLTVIVENTLDLLAIGASSDITVYIENIKANATASAVTVAISKPTGSSGLVLAIGASPDWTIAESTNQFTLTLVGNIAGLGTKLFTANLSRSSGNRGTYNFSPVITNNSGGETNNLNNRASVVFTKN